MGHSLLLPSEKKRSVSLKHGYSCEGASHECRDAQRENRELQGHRSQLHVLCPSLGSLHKAVSLREVTSSGHTLAPSPLAIGKNGRRTRTKKYGENNSNIFPAQTLHQIKLTGPPVMPGTHGAHLVGTCELERTLEGFRRAAVLSSLGSRCPQSLVVEHSEHICRGRHWQTGCCMSITYSPCRF